MIWSQRIIRKKKIFDSSYRDRHRENDELIIVRKIVESFWNEEMWAIHQKLHLTTMFQLSKIRSYR
jgi:hypothetical protein